MNHLPKLPNKMDQEAIDDYIASYDQPAANRTVKMDDGLYQYLVQNSVREHELLQQLRAETSLYHMARMQVSVETGQLLALLVKLSNAKRILEVGVFTGYSTLSMALAMADDAELIAIDKKQMWLDIANKYIAKAGLESRVKTCCGAALGILQQLTITESGYYDFIFIDADKSNQIQYYQLAKQLVRSGGCIVIDNTLWWGNVANPEFNDKDTMLVRELNQLIHQDQEVDISLIPIGDGLTLIRKR